MGSEEVTQESLSWVMARRPLFARGVKIDGHHPSLANLAGDGGNVDIQAVLVENCCYPVCSSSLVILGLCPHSLQSSLLRFRHVIIPKDTDLLHIPELPTG